MRSRRRETQRTKLAYNLQSACLAARRRSSTPHCCCCSHACCLKQGDDVAAPLHSYQSDGGFIQMGFKLDYVIKQSRRRACGWRACSRRRRAPCCQAEWRCPVRARAAACLHGVCMLFARVFVCVFACVFAVYGQSQRTRGRTLPRQQHAAHTKHKHTHIHTHTHVNMHTHIHSRADTHLGLLGHEAGSTHDASGEHVRVSAHDAVQGDHWG